MTEYISEENEKTIRNLLASCKKAVPGVVFKIRDTEELVIKSSDIDEIITAIDGGDEEIGINAFGQDGKILGWFGILPYEATDIVFDYSANAFCDSVMKCVEEVSDDNAY